MLYVNSCCCTCLNTENLRNIHVNDAENVKILDKLLFCLTEKDSIFECAPLLICENCCKMLQEFYNFKKTSQKNLDLFRNCLQQLIKNPFSDLRLQVKDKQDNGQPADVRQAVNVSPDHQIQIISNETSENVVANVQIGAIVKVEDIDDNSVDDNQLFTVQPETSRNETDSSTVNNQNFSLKIHNVESLNTNYKTRLTKSLSAVDTNTDETLERNKLKPKRAFPKKTICHPCGKKFIRDDFFIKHILSCTKNDIKTKNSVLNWVSNKTRELVVTGKMALNPTPRVNLVNCNFKPNTSSIHKFEPEKTLEDRHLKTETPIKKKNIEKRKLDRFERMVCHLCKRNITARFFRRHFARCSMIVKTDEQMGEMLTILPINKEITNDENV